MGLIKGKASTSPAAAPGRPKFSYVKRSADEVLERANRRVGNNDGIYVNGAVLFVSREGDNTIRYMPPPSAEKSGEWKHYGVSISAHYEIGADKSQFLCLYEMKGDPCPLCEERSRANNAGEDEFAKQLRPRKSVIAYVIDRNQKNKGPMIWKMSDGMDKDITKLAVNPKTGKVLFYPDDPDDGFDFSFVRTGIGMKTKYSGEQFERETSPLSDDQEEYEKWMGYIAEHPLDEMLVFHDYEYIAKVFEGQAPPPAKEAKDETGKEAAISTAAAEEKQPAKTRPRLQPAAAKAAEQEQVELPTWEQMLEMDDTILEAVGNDFKVEFPADGFPDIDEMRDFIAKAIGVEKPKPAAAPAASVGGSWKDRLKKKTA